MEDGAQYCLIFNEAFKKFTGFQWYVVAKPIMITMSEFQGGDCMYLFGLLRAAVCMPFHKAQGAGKTLHVSRVTETQRRVASAYYKSTKH